MAAMLALPNNVNPGMSAPAQPLGLVFEHRFDGISDPLQVFQPFLGPDHPGCVSVITTGLFREINFWWKQFANHSVILFTPRNFRSRPPININHHSNGRVPLYNPYYTIRRRDSLSICGECARTLSRRTCDGTTTKSYQGCDFHRAKPQVPFAYRRRDIYPPTTSFLRNVKAMLWNHHSQVDMFYLSPNPISPKGTVHTITPGLVPVPGHPLQGATVTHLAAATTPSLSGPNPSPISPEQLVTLEKVTFLRDFRAVNERARLPRVEYIHTPHCLHGSDPQCIIQGRNLQGLYYQQCDGSFANALGEVLEGATGILSPLQKKKRGHRVIKLDVEQGQQGQASAVDNVNETNINATAVNAATVAAAAASAVVAVDQPRNFCVGVSDMCPRKKPSASSSSSSDGKPSSPTNANASSSSKKNKRPGPALSSSEVAEHAWRSHHPAAGPNTWAEIEAIRRREALAEAKQLRAQKRRQMLPRAEMWVERRKEGLKGRVEGWGKTSRGAWAESR